jgi:hypothetical protein
MARTITSRLAFLLQIKAVGPEAYDFLYPHLPKLSTPTRELAMAAIVRDIAFNLTNKDLQKRLLSAGKEQVAFAAGGLINGWEDGDDICPTWPFPFHWPAPGPGPDPDPNPWYTGRQESILEYANALKVIAGLSAVPAVSKQLTDIAGALHQQRFNV